MYRIAGLTPYVFSPIFCKKLMKMLDLPRVFFSIFSKKCIELLDLPLFFPDILPKIYENAGLTLFISLFFFFNILSQFDKIDGLRHTPCDFYNICQQNNNKIAWLPLVVFSIFCENLIKYFPSPVKKKDQLAKAVRWHSNPPPIEQMSYHSTPPSYSPMARGSLNLMC